MTRGSKTGGPDEEIWSSVTPKNSCAYVGAENTREMFRAEEDRKRKGGVRRESGGQTSHASQHLNVGEHPAGGVAGPTRSSRH